MPFANIAIWVHLRRSFVRKENVIDFYSIGDQKK